MLRHISGLEIACERQQFCQWFGCQPSPWAPCFAVFWKPRVEPSCWKPVRGTSLRQQQVSVSYTRDLDGSHCINTCTSCYGSVTFPCYVPCHCPCHLLFLVCIYAVWYDFCRGHLFFFVCYVCGLLWCSPSFHMTLLPSLVTLAHRPLAKV